MLTGAAASGCNPAGFMQASTGVTAGEGYGLFSFTGNAGVAGQGMGICMVLWPLDTIVCLASQQVQASEIDLLESQDGTRTGFSTLH